MRSLICKQNREMSGMLGKSNKRKCLAYQRKTRGIFAKIRRNIRLIRIVFYLFVCCQAQDKI